MSELKSNPVILGAGIGDILKYEATPMTRISVSAPAGTKAGAAVAVPYKSRSSDPIVLIALTDEKEGTVLVQPHNCVIDLSLTSAAQLSATLGETVPEGDILTALADGGDAYGIVYTGTPAA